MQTSGILLLIFSIAPLLSSLIWVLDLFTHFRFQYFFFSLLLLIGFIVYRNKLYVTIAAGCVFINAFYIMPIYIQQPHDSTDLHNKTIKLFYANVLTNNRQYEKLLNQITKENPDVIVLQEVDATWIANMDAIKAKYKFVIKEPRTDNFGMALFSRVPIIDSEVHYWSDFDIPNIEVMFELDGLTLHMIATHPPPPVNKRFHDAKKSIFKSITNVVNAKTQATVVIGDLNTTIWSDTYELLESETGLINASRGLGFMPTWPTQLLPLMIPIDHCLVSKQFKVINIKTGNEFGSDHLPLVVELLF